VNNRKKKHDQSRGRALTTSPMPANRNDYLVAVHPVGVDLDHRESVDGARTDHPSNLI
jgi:hypothetical protein